ncbi:MAG: tRNA (adenosine(37)-N6)-threonylcarbamoyltransferase complex ATPase subunit type 1 TsaE [Pseudomonadota bacterium]
MQATRQDHYLPNAAATSALGVAVAGCVRNGDTLLLSGGIGAGKSHFCRALIQSAQVNSGQAPEEVPSPTYTLVQSYRAGPLSILHADLYRLGGPAEADEIGLLDAFGRDLCIVEWPDRLGGEAPVDALHLQFSIPSDGEGRAVCLTARGGDWPKRLAPLGAFGEMST